MTKRNRGFTLIELLVVIAIIGILSSVVLASLNSARVKGRIAGAQSTARSVTNALSMCLNDNVAIVTPAVGTAVCSGSATTWPALPSGWGYGAFSQSTGASFSFVVSSTGDGKTITCTEGGCVTQ